MTAGPPTSEVLSALEVVRQKAVVERHSDREWWVMLPDGSIGVYRSARFALAAVRRHDEDVLDVTRSSVAIVTTVEWRGVPDGWTPPTR